MNILVHLDLKHMKKMREPAVKVDGVIHNYIF